MAWWIMVLRILLLFAIGIAVNTLVSADPESATLIQETITAAAVLNELIAVVLAKVGFTKTGEIGKAENEEKDSSVSASTRTSSSHGRKSYRLLFLFSFGKVTKHYRRKRK